MLLFTKVWMYACVQKQVTTLINTTIYLGANTSANNISSYSVQGKQTQGYHIFSP